MKAILFFPRSKCSRLYRSSKISGGKLVMELLESRITFKAWRPLNNKLGRLLSLLSRKSTYCNWTKSLKIVSRATRSFFCKEICFSDDKPEKNVD